MFYINSNFTTVRVNCEWLEATPLYSFARQCLAHFGDRSLDDDPVVAQQYREAKARMAETVVDLEKMGMAVL